MEAAAKLTALRSLLAEKFPAPAARPRASYATGLTSLDEAIGGGLPCGAMSEIVRAAPGCGSAVLLHRIVECVASRGGRLALVDAADSFDPDDFENETLRGLFWVRCKNAEMATRATDWLTRDGNLPLVVTDFTLCPLVDLRRIPVSTWYRLNRAAEEFGVAALSLTPQPLVASAALRMELRHRFRLGDMGRSRSEVLQELEIGFLRRREAFAPIEEGGKIIAFPRAAA